MGFLDNETLKSLEGKYIKFLDGVERKLRLVSHKAEQRDGNYGPYVANVLTVVDEEVGEEKIIGNADRSFMNSLSKINDKLKEGSIIVVSPRSKTVMTKNGAKEVLDYTITIDGEGLDSQKL